MYTKHIFAQAGIVWRYYQRDICNSLMTISLDNKSIVKNLRIVDRYEAYKTEEALIRYMDHTVIG